MTATPEEVRPVLEVLLTDIKACRSGKVPTGATLYSMQNRIEAFLRCTEESRDQPETCLTTAPKPDIVVV